MAQPAVFLDRDGVLNRAFPDGRSTRPPRTLEELEILPGVPDALARLRAAGYALVGVSNQPDVARGLSPASAVEAVNAALRARLPLCEILTCLHDDGDGCDCRKPRPGLLLDAARRFGLDLPRSFMVGDRWSDVLAGQAAGCASSLLIDGPFSQAERCRPDWSGDSLSAAADWILGRDATRPASVAGGDGDGDRTAALAKLRCRQCGAPAVWRDGACCSAGHAFAAPTARAAGPRPWGERVFDHPQALGAKVALLSLLNGIPRGSLERFTAGREVLDLGCGSYQYHYRPERTTVRVGLDISVRCTATADRLYPRSLHLTASLADPLPFPERSFDVVVLLSVLHHLPRAIVPGVLEQALRVARHEVVVLDHTRSDDAWKRSIQQRYWDTFDGGDLYRSNAEWDALFKGQRIVEHRRLGVLFRNVCLYRLAV